MIHMPQVVLPSGVKETEVATLSRVLKRADSFTVWFISTRLQNAALVTEKCK